MWGFPGWHVTCIFPRELIWEDVADFKTCLWILELFVWLNMKCAENINNAMNETNNSVNILVKVSAVRYTKENRKIRFPVISLEKMYMYIVPLSNWSALGLTLTHCFSWSQMVTCCFRPGIFNLAQTVILGSNWFNVHNVWYWCLGPIARPMLGACPSHSEATACPCSPIIRRPIAPSLHLSLVYSQHSNKDTGLTTHASYLVFVSETVRLAGKWLPERGEYLHYNIPKLF